MATVLNAPVAGLVRLHRRLFAQLKTDVDHYDYSIQRYSPRPDSERAGFYEQRGRRMARSDRRTCPRLESREVFTSGKEFERR